MKKYITRLLSGLTSIVALTYLSANIAAEPKQAPLPTKHADPTTEMQQGIVAAFVEQAYENARINSPFATFNAEQAATPLFKGSPLAGKMIDYASRFLGTRYRLGASGPSAFDCSGFTSYIFRNFGIELKRSSRMQYEQGIKVSINDLQPGDLLFFSSTGSGRGRVGHVAIVASVDQENGTCKFIHASVKKGVTYQNFPDGAYYSKHFIGARRVIGDDQLQASK